MDVMVDWHEWLMGNGQSKAANCYMRAGRFQVDDFAAEGAELNIESSVLYRAKKRLKLPDQQYLPLRY